MYRSFFRFKIPGKFQNGSKKGRFTQLVPYHLAHRNCDLAVTVNGTIVYFSNLPGETIKNQC